MPIKLLAHCLKIRLLAGPESFRVLHTQLLRYLISLILQYVFFIHVTKCHTLGLVKLIKLTYHSVIYTPYNFEQIDSSFCASTSTMELTVLHQVTAKIQRAIPIKRSDQQGRWKTPSATLGREARAGWRHCNTQTCDREVGKRKTQREQGTETDWRPDGGEGERAGGYAVITKYSWRALCISLELI